MPLNEHLVSLGSTIRYMLQFSAMAHYEIEIKSLLGALEHAEALKERMRKNDPAFTFTARNSQLNHYFEGGDVAQLVLECRGFFDPLAQEKLDLMATYGKNISVRTRQKNGEAFLVLKASIDTDSSANGIARLEFEERVPLSLSELDERVQDAGFVYQAKWSRDREEYVYKNCTVCIDRNAGYGYLVEFEKIVEREEEASAARAELYALMEELRVEELAQERLERMFQFYNQHWSEYYGTDKVFVIE